VLIRMDAAEREGRQRKELYRWAALDSLLSSFLHQTVTRVSQQRLPVKGSRSSTFHMVCINRSVSD